MAIRGNMPKLRKPIQVVKVAVPKESATLIILKGHQYGNMDLDHYLEQWFVPSERSIALALAEKWDEKGWKPLVYSTNYGGPRQILYNWRNRKRKKAA